jgi:hypothetical protein
MVADSLHMSFPMREISLCTQHAFAYTPDMSPSGREMPFYMGAMSPCGDAMFLCRGELSLCTCDVHQCRASESG